LVSKAVLLSFAAMAAAKLTKKEIDEFEVRLRAERTELAEQLATIEAQTFATSQSDLSGDVGVDDESADAGTATFEREKELSIEQNVRDLIQKIDRALKRIVAGTYGICERCGKPIEKARIKALPYVDLCIKDAQAQSRR
jgi:DnaK suppressor protein